MTEQGLPVQIFPGRGLGWMTLGASLHGILSRIKAQPQAYPQLDLSYSASEPIHDPVVINLPSNGIRLRFDGPDQRLRLIEILDFSKTFFAYKSFELVRRASSSSDNTSDPVLGPSFRHVYNRLFGPSYAGEYVAPEAGYPIGTYVLSYPGLAVRFPLKHKCWSEKADFVALLSSSAASPASSIAIFSGASWPEARSTLYTKIPNLPRSISLATKGIENIPDEIEEFLVCGRGKLELTRRSSPPIVIKLNETTPQDLIAELGAPDAIFRKSGARISIHAGQAASQIQSRLSPSLDSHYHSADNDHISAKSYTDDSENEIQNANNDELEALAPEFFYNYFHHGFDVLIATHSMHTLNAAAEDEQQPKTSADVVVTKIFLHGNIPGSYSFNRHRRSRWRILLGEKGDGKCLTSEMRFTDLSTTLKRHLHGTYANKEEEKRMQRGMVLNRGWGESPESSIELLGGFEEGLENTTLGSAVAENLPSMNNTELFGFPGLLFEVLKNDTITCLTVY